MNVNVESCGCGWVYRAVFWIVCCSVVLLHFHEAMASFLDVFLEGWIFFLGFNLDHSVSEGGQRSHRSGFLSFLCSFPFCGNISYSVAWPRKKLVCQMVSPLIAEVLNKNPLIIVWFFSRWEATHSRVLGVLWGFRVCFAQSLFLSCVCNSVEEICAELRSCQRSPMLALLSSSVLTLQTVVFGLQLWHTS